jgi:hypothetical protein
LTGSIFQHIAQFQPHRPRTEAVLSDADRFFRSPIINSPYEMPIRHWELDAQMVVLSQPYHAPLRDVNDLPVLQTAERGAAEVLCTNDGDFHDDPGILGYCAVRGIEVCYESTLLARIYES